MTSGITHTAQDVEYIGASVVQIPSAHMTDQKNSNRNNVRTHPYCKKGIEPGTSRHKAAIESAAIILAKGSGEPGASLEEKDKLVELWDNICCSTPPGQIPWGQQGGTDHDEESRDCGVGKVMAWTIG